MDMVSQVEVPTMVVRGLIFLLPVSYIYFFNVHRIVYIYIYISFLSFSNFMIVTKCHDTRCLESLAAATANNGMVQNAAPGGESEHNPAAKELPEYLRQRLRARGILKNEPGKVVPVRC